MHPDFDNTLFSSFEMCEYNLLSQVYAPDRGPPLLDFLFVLTAFFAAVFAAYYTIFTETGLS